MIFDWRTKTVQKSEIINHQSLILILKIEAETEIELQYSLFHNQQSKIHNLQSLIFNRYSTIVNLSHFQ